MPAQHKSKLFLHNWAGAAVEHFLHDGLVVQQGELLEDVDCTGEEVDVLWLGQDQNKGYKMQAELVGAVLPVNNLLIHQLQVLLLRS